MTKCNYCKKNTKKIIIIKEESKFSVKETPFYLFATQFSFECFI
jgi:hypothetical protein